MFVKDYGQKMKFFSEELSSEFLEAVNVSGRKTVIFECEFFALMCALITWKDIIGQSNIVIHTDNDGVRDAFISCHTTSKNALPILDACLKVEFLLQSNTWITRVPTESNFADDPSRLPFDLLVRAGCARDRFEPLELWKMCVQQTGQDEMGEAIDQSSFPFRQKTIALERGSSAAT